MMNKTVFVVAISLLAAAARAGAAAPPAESYATELSRVYEATQFIRAVKEGCDSAHKENAAANAAAYNSWAKRHRAFLNELDRRVMMLIHGASTDEKDYAKNVGRYMGDVVQYREILKQDFLGGPADNVQRQCNEFPQYLKSAEADLPKRFAAELKSIRKRKL
ncbi:MAG TPA: hypothetical protein VKF40_28855 [Burkholderiales bacterium]|nr:hypothetical protein [Burkholderiales bacterium]